jgi:hypothetical protein
MEEEHLVEIQSVPKSVDLLVKYTLKYLEMSLWDVVVHDTHVLERMFAVAMDGLMNV